MTSAPRLARRRPRSRPAGPPPTMHVAVRVVVTWAGTAAAPPPERFRAAPPGARRSRSGLATRGAVSGARSGGHAQAHGDAEGAADAAALGRLAEGRHLRLVETAVEDQLRLDGHDAPLRLRGLQSRLEPSNRPLAPFGEPPNVGELSGADGPQQHFGRRRALVPA